MSDRKPLISDEEARTMGEAGQLPLEKIRYVLDLAGSLVRKRLAERLRARHSELVNRIQRPCFGGYCDCDGVARFISGEEEK